ncbi:SdiA-regulated domain-containing protein [Aestuariivivens insulae]|uniref:SdiA-regulated domain-containing protein n=1 Tax=Aestuariivivens insulae TaxID=1621988 RepID=UPI001F5656CC|nr:SdiA-regulated domain-containing protein [Aestuariivivens insulae]
MPLQITYLPFFLLLFLSCDTGKLTFVANLSNDLDEASAIQAVKGSKLLWTIEDAGNKNNIYGIDLKGNIIKDIAIDNAKNEDWEDLTADHLGNLYIGDFGNNNKKRKHFTIYKINDVANLENKAHAEIIRFKLPKNLKPKDFEAFFLLNNEFYIFSKENKSSLLLKVPNTIGEHTAKLVDDFDLEGKHHKITSAAVSPNGKTIVLLNHDKLWKLTKFKSTNFFKGTVEPITFEHNSQKEGICFKDDQTVYITDERSHSEGGNLYAFEIN